METQLRNGQAADATDCLRAYLVLVPESTIARLLLENIHRRHGKIEGNDDWRLP